MNTNSNKPSRAIITIFRDLENAHLCKDVGMIPFLLHKYHGYTAVVATYNRNRTYEYLENELNGLQVVYIKRIFNINILDEIIFIFKNYNKFNIFYSIHFNLKSYVWNACFKMFRRKECITYLKLDGNPTLYRDKYRKGLKGLLYSKFRKSTDIISGETKVLCSTLTDLWGMPIMYIPNGFYRWNDAAQPLIKKEKLIIASGRIGAPEKMHEFLCEAFARIADKHPDWKLYFVGEVQPVFEAFTVDYFRKYPHLKDTVCFTGNAANRSILDEYYQRASILALTSIAEGFPLVFPEALGAGCYIISSDQISAYDITDNQRYGRIFKTADMDDLIRVLREAIYLHDNGDIDHEEIRSFANDHFNWITLVNAISKKINELLDRKES